MQPKTINILYWVFTILFAALMIFSSYGSIVVNDDAKKLIHEQLGYPVYFIPFTGYAKLIGAIIILIPGLKTIKEWAYAGLFFDLIGATFSIIAVGAPVSNWVFMIVPLSLAATSYLFYRKKLRIPNLSASHGITINQIPALG